MPNKREAIMQSIMSALAQISTANGYNTNVGASVHEWRAVPFDPSDLPALNVRDLFEETEVGSPQSKWALRTLYVQIEALTVGQGGPQLAREIVADIERALGNVTAFEDGTSIQVEPTLTGRFLLDQHERAFVGVIYEFKVKYQTRKFDY